MRLGDRILLATDLSARSDRALDRAVALALDGGAHLTVLHVIEPVPGNRYHPRTLSAAALAALARRQLAVDLGALAETAEIRIEGGDPAEVIEQIAREERCHLVVVGVARIERLGRFTLGKTVERLVRGAHTPLLIVTDRPRAPYRKVAVAVDFTRVSLRTVELALHWFPAQRITLFHASHPLTAFTGLDGPVHREQSLDSAHARCREWLAASALARAAAELIDVQIELGCPERLVREAAERGAFDLLMIGTHGHGRIFEFFIGSVAQRILAELPCDALFVREAHLQPAPGAVAHPDEPGAARGPG